MDTSNELVHSVDPDGLASVVLTTAGAIRSLNASMTEALGEPPEKYIGRDFAGFLPETQRTAVKVLVSHAARSRTPAPAIRVLEFQGHSDVPTACLVQAQVIRTGEEGHRLVWIREVDAQDDLDSLLIPVRAALRGGCCRRRSGPGAERISAQHLRGDR
ncbi:PAS domain-containing protein [Streptomyces sp. NPDC002206]